MNKFKKHGTMTIYIWVEPVLVSPTAYKDHSEGKAISTMSALPAFNYSKVHECAGWKPYNY